MHPTTRELWLAEYGPNGGDEINILGAGRNYGWPLVGLGRSHEGPYTAEAPHRDGMERAVADFVPGIWFDRVAEMWRDGLVTRAGSPKGEAGGTP